MERGTAIDIGLLHPMPGKTMALATCVVAIAVHNQVGDNVRGAEQSLKPAEKGANPVPASDLTGAEVNRCISSKNPIRNAVHLHDRKRVVSGKRVSARVDHGCRRLLKKKMVRKQQYRTNQ